MVDDYTAEREREREGKCFFPLQKFSKTTQREEVLYEKEKFF
jgi:hypothetical protein